jgi:AraC family transcriptional regulator
MRRGRLEFTIEAHTEQPSMRRTEWRTTTRVPKTARHVEGASWMRYFDFIRAAHMRAAAATHPKTSSEFRDRTLATAGEVQVGEFRCTPDERDFGSAGPITRHCLVFPRRGVWIRHEDRPAFVADPTRITLYNPRQPYERRALDPSGDRSDWITVSDAVAREVMARYDPRAADSPDGVFRFPYAPAHSRLYLEHRCVHEYVRRHPAPDLLFVEETTVNLFARTISALYGPAETQRRDDARLTQRRREMVEAVCAYLNTTYRRNESLSAIAGLTGTSVFHLCRVFRQGTGVTLHAYRHHLRLRSALEPLQHRNVDLLTVALNLGYSGHSHFTASFRRQFGVVPSRLRERMGAEPGPEPSARPRAPLARS